MSFPRPIEPDSESRAALAIGAMDGLATLVEGQTPGITLDPETLGPLIRLVMSAAIDALPRHSPLHPASDND